MSEIILTPPNGNIKRFRLNKWRSRYALIDDNKYLCIYVDHTKKKLEDKIEIIQEHKIIINNTNKVFEHKICLLSSKGFRHGSHEWIIKIRKCDIYTQEISVIGTNNIDEIGVIDDGGIKLTNKCGYGATAKPTIPTINPTPSPTLEPTTPAPTRIGTKNHVD
eukprot:36584_1